MADPEYPKSAAADAWRKTVGALDTQKVGGALETFRDLFDDLPIHLYCTDGLMTADDARERLDQAIDIGGKAAKALSDQARTIRAAVNKILDANKKNTDAAKALKYAEATASDAEALGKEVVALSARSAAEIKALISKLPPAPPKKAGDKGKAPPLNPKLVAHNNKVRAIVNKLRAGTHPRTPFVVLQNKVRVPFNRSKPWEKKSIVHVGPRAVKSCRSELERLLLPELHSADFTFFFGEVELQGPKGKGKLVFEFESPLSNSKQLKDALLFQCKYSPPLQLRKKGSAEVIDEAAEGNESDAEGEDEVEDDDAAADAPAAKTPWQAAKPAAAENAEVAKVRAGLVDAQDKARSGITSLMKRITTVYKNAAGPDLESVKTALRRLDALNKKLAVDVAGPMAKIAEAKAAPDRGKLKKDALDRVKALGAVVAGEDLMEDIDRNELLPGLVVVEPLKDKLKQAIAVLR